MEALVHLYWMVRFFIFKGELVLLNPTMAARCERHGTLVCPQPTN